MAEALELSQRHGVGDRAGDTLCRENPKANGLRGGGLWAGQGEGQQGHTRTPGHSEGLQLIAGLTRGRGRRQRFSPAAVPGAHAREWRTGDISN